jgi:hypothetical protein
VSIANTIRYLFFFRNLESVSFQNSLEGWIRKVSFFFENKVTTACERSVHCGTGTYIFKGQSVIIGWSMDVSDFGNS